jgi:SAM-dependent methyltransferase
MLKETYTFLRHGPALKKRQKQLGLVEFYKELVARSDTDGFRKSRSDLVGDLSGEILEIGAGTGATFQYYRPDAKITAIEPDEGFRQAAIEATKSASCQIEVIEGSGEKLPFANASFDYISVSAVLCSVESPQKTLEEFKRVLRPGGEIRLFEHIRSEHWLAGPLMDLMNPVWLRLNKMGCNWNRRTVNEVKAAGLQIVELNKYNIYSRAMPAAYPLRVIKAKFSV